MAKSTEQLCRELDALYKENSRDKLEAFFMEEILDHVPGCCDVSNEYIFLMNEAGAYYRSISCYEQAASYFQGLLSTMERFGLNGSTAYATVLNNLAGVYRMTGQLEQAQELFQQALTCYEAAGAGNSAEYTSALNNLSLCYQAGHDLEKALYYQKKALSCSQQLSAAPEALAASYVNIGALYCAAGDMDRAIPGMFPFIFLIIVILGGIYSGITTPTEAAAVSVIVALILSAITGGLTWQSVKESLLETIKSYCMIAFIVIGAKFFTYIITMSGVSRGITSWFTSLNASPLAFFLFIIAIYLVLGCLMDGTSIIYLTIPVVYPLIQLAGFDPIWFGVVLTALVEVAMLTPPVDMNLFVLHGITKGTCEFKDIIKGCFPYILLYALLIALLWCFPSIATWLPHSM